MGAGWTRATRDDDRRVSAGGLLLVPAVAALPAAALFMLVWRTTIPPGSSRSLALALAWRGALGALAFALPALLAPTATLRWRPGPPVVGAPAPVTYARPVVRPRPRSSSAPPPFAP